MPADKYCLKCREAKVPVRGDPDWCLLVFLFCLAVFPGIIYLVLFYTSTPNRCIICNSELVPLSAAPQQASLASVPAVQTPAQPPATQVKADPSPASRSIAGHPAAKFCPYCGSELVSGAKFCPNCGTAM